METFVMKTRIFNSLDLILVSCLFVAVESQTGQILPPQNLSFLWSSDFYPQLSWVPPPHSMENCLYQLTVKNKNKDLDEIIDVSRAPWCGFKVMDGGFLQLSVKTVCGDTNSEEVSTSVTYPEFVTELQCSIRSSSLTKCTWVNVFDVPDLQFFYRLPDEHFSYSPNSQSKCSSSNVKECSSYKYNRTGCDLRANHGQRIHISFKATLNDEPVRNTFTKKFTVRLDALNWTVDETEKEFVFNWRSPEIIGLKGWTFIIKYNECGTEKEKSVVGETSAKLGRVPHCPYQITIYGKAGKSQETKMGDSKHFDAVIDSSAVLYVSIIIPLMCGLLAALALACCWMNKEIILPKIPVPRDLISQIPDNNNKIAAPNHDYSEEEVCSTVSLVMESQTEKFYP